MRMERQRKFSSKQFRYIALKTPFHERHFRKLFTAWHEILNWYEEDIMKDDLPYWYLERTNIGNLALATYQLSGFPLQEFSCVKGRGASRSDGRADLYTILPKRTASRGKNLAMYTVT